MRTLILLFATLTFSGCGALIGGGIREGFDHGDDAVYENKSYWEHVADVAFETEPEPEPCHTTTVVVHHH